MNAPLNEISGLSKLLLIRLRKSAKGQGQKGFAIVLFTVACILGSAFPLPLISSLGSSTVIAQTVDERKAEASHLLQQGLEQLQLNQSQAALQFFKQALAIYQASGDRAGELEALIRIGDTYSDAQAVEYFLQALTLARELGDRQKEVTILSKLSYAYEYYLNDPRQALEYTYQQLVAIRKLPNRYEEGLVLYFVASGHEQLGELSQALEYYEQGLAYIKRFPREEYTSIWIDLDDYHFLNGIASVYERLSESEAQRGYVPQAILHLEKSLAIARQIPAGRRTFSSESILLARLGTLHRSTGNYPQAIAYLEQGWTLIQNESNERGMNWGWILLELGNIYSEIGNYSRAVEYFEQYQALAQEQLALEPDIQALKTPEGLREEFAEEIKNIPSLADDISQGRLRVVIDFERSERSAFINLGDAYEKLGDFSKAIEHYQQALVLAQRHQSRTDEVWLLLKLGFAYLNSGDTDRAITTLKQSLAVAQTLDDPQQEARASINLGIAYLRINSPAEAIPLLKASLAIARQIQDADSQAWALRKLGDAHYSLGNLEQALSAYRQQLVIVQQNQDRRQEGEVLHKLGVTLAVLGNLDAATAQLFEAANIWDSLRPGLDDIDQVSLFEQQTKTYAFLQTVLVGQSRVDNALEVAERGRARAFVNLLAQRLAIVPKTTDTAMSLSVEQMQQVAQQQNATLIQYSVIDSGINAPVLYIWVIQPTGEIHFQSVDFKSLDRPLSDLVITSREAIGVRNRNELATIVPELTPEAQQRQQAQQRQKLQQLHQLLIEPITQYLPTNPDERVIFIPQGELFLVPFPALVDAQGKYLIEKHTILTAPSIQVLDLTRQQRKSIRANSSSPIPGDNVLVVGNPIMPKVWNPAKGIEEQLSSLPGAEEEAVTIAKAFAIKPLLWEQASESAVIQQMPKARIIHLSTHGLLEYGTPQDSGVRDFPGAIALSPSSKDDGLLTSAEILQMKLKAELVVLSACDTGRGKITGDGVIGLSRSLITAGVPSVIVSLWSVPDAPTADLMSEFYRQWQQHPDKAKALRQAMLITMQNHPNPRDWAAFTLIGEAE